MILSVEEVTIKGNQTIPVKLVFVRNRNNRQDYLILVSTDVNLSEYSAPQSQVNLLLRATCYAARSHP